MRRSVDREGDHLEGVCWARARQVVMIACSSQSVSQSGMTFTEQQESQLRTARYNTVQGWTVDVEMLRRLSLGLLMGLIG